jgi:hypothetical protein
MSTNTNCTAQKIADNPLLASPCACQKSAEDLQVALATYTKQTDQYNLDLLDYKTKHGKWEIDNTQWLKDKQKQIDTLANEVVTGSTGTWWVGACLNASCTGGWDIKETQGVGAGCQVNCKRSAQQVTNDLGPWLEENAQPVEPTFVEKPPNGINGNSIQCCSQLFNNISGDNPNFSNITQQCTQLIGQEMADFNKGKAPSSGISTTSSTSTKSSSRTTTPSTTSTFFTLPVIILLCLVFFMCIAFFFCGGGVLLLSS